jgi:hypothetical protein
MSPASTAIRTSAPRFSAAKLANFRLIPRIETYPRVVELAQTPLGKIVLVSLFGLGLRYFYSDSMSVVLTAFFLVVMTLLPEYRRFVLATTPIMIVIIQTHGEPLVMGLTLGVVGLGAFLYWCAMRWPKSRFGQRPIIFLLTGFSVLIFLACAAKLHTVLYSFSWALVGVMASYVWFIAYALTDRSSKPASDFTLELATFRPMWGSTNTPFPKGAAYLRRIEAKTPEQLAVTQLKGLKLLAWAILLAVVQTAWYRFFHGYLHLPLADQALAMSVRGTPAPWHMRWIAQILTYFELVLNVSIFGHRIIACARMAGFNALRNTYRPLSSTSLIEFFNRFYYYFKELLVDLFFYPAFLRYFKKHRRLRTIFATFAAIVFGDTFYHITRDWQFFRDLGFWKGIASYQVEFVYMIVLAIALSISQLKKRVPKPTGFLRGRLLPTAGVALFYILVSFFETDTRAFSLAQTARYFASMFFIHF